MQELAGIRHLTLVELLVHSCQRRIGVLIIELVKAADDLPRRRRLLLEKIGTVVQ
ncbi:hypothetical protein D3C78_1852800 [compost metagenome]